MTVLGDRLRAARYARGITQAQLGAMVGSSQAVIQKIENGKSRRPRIVRDLARALNIPPEWLSYGVVGQPATLKEALEAMPPPRDQP